MGTYCALLKTEIKYFVLVANSMRVINWYSKTYDIEVHLQNNTFPGLNPAKIQRMMQTVAQIVDEYRGLCEEYFERNISLLYQLSPAVFVIYMKKYGNIRHALYGARIARIGWLNKAHGVIISPIYEKHLKTKWADFIYRFRPDCAKKALFIPLPYEVCELISDYLIHVELGETFLQYFEKNYDNLNRRIKMENTNCRIFKRTTDVFHLEQSFTDAFHVEVRQFVDNI
jgi:hypothetical protein